MKPNGGRLSEFSYTYDLAGRQITKTDLYGTTDYEYDKAGRITKVATSGKTTVYLYDKAGNRVSQNETYTSLQPSDYVDESTGKEIQYILKKSDYTYSNTNQLLKLVERMFDENNKEIARKTTKYSYDSNGNQLKQSISHSLPNNTGLRPKTTGTAYGDNVSNTIDKLVEKTSYTYDGFNRLKKTETVKAGIRTTVDFTYNGDDLRVSKTVKKSDRGYQAEVTNYLYDRQNVILETNASNNIKARYVKGTNYIAKADAAGKESYFLYNGHGDVVQTVDAAGTVENQYDYDIWGNPTLTVETISNAIRYTGEFYDEETGLYYLRARYYDPYLGRFTTEDSYWGEDDNPLSLNLYTYCENDPVQYTDPTGHTTDWEIDWFMGRQGDPSEYKNGMRVTKSSSSSSGSTVTLSDVADATTWSKGSSKATFSFNGTQQDLYVENGKAYDSWGNVRGTIENGHIVVTNKEFNNMFGNTTGSVSNSTTVNVKQGDHVTSASTYAGSNVTINNYGIMDTITTGKNSSLVLNNYGTAKNVNVGENGTAKIYNYEGGRINKITGGDITDDEKKGKVGMYIGNKGIIDYVLTGKYSQNEINNYDEVGAKLTLETGEGNSTIILNGQYGVSLRNGRGEIVYRLYKGTNYYDINVNDLYLNQRLEVMINKEGWSFKPNEGTKYTEYKKTNSFLFLGMGSTSSQGTGNPVKVVSPVWQSSDADYSPAVQSMLLELNFDWYFADSIEEQNRIVQRAKDIRKDAEDGIEWWVDKAGKITSAAADEFSWFLGGSPSANERDKWLEMNQMFQSDLTIKDNQSLKAGMFIAGVLMPGPGSGEANAAGRVLKSWIKHGTYNEVKETLGKEGVEQFIKAMNKGIVGGVKENGIKLLSGEGIEAGGKYYKYELKVLGKGTSHYRILGNYDQKTGHVIFEKLVNLK